MYFIIAVVIILLVFLGINYFSNSKKKTTSEKTLSKVNKNTQTTPKKDNLSKKNPSNIFTSESLNLYTRPDKPDSLTKYYIPTSYFKINKDAFKLCTNLKDIYIHDDVTVIEDKSFINCINLMNIHIDDDNKKYCSKSGSLFTKDSNIIISYPPSKQTASYFIPQGVETINSFAFTNSKFLKYVILPNTIKTISENSFVNCKNLKQIVIPDTVTDIHPKAFNMCPLLTIRSYKDSASEEYCKNYYIPFEYLSN